MTKRMQTVEVYPGLFQRANMLSWSYDQKKALFKEHGITVVISLYAKVDPDMSGQVMYVAWPIRGNELPHSRVLILAASALLKQGEKILVVCEAGVNRSIWFCAEVISTLNGWPLKQAHEHIAALTNTKVHQALSGEEDAA